MSKNVIDKTIKSVKRIMLFSEIMKIREKYNIKIPLLDDIPQDRNDKG
jgi:hypothetical protein